MDINHMDLVFYTEVPPFIFFYRMKVYHFMPEPV